MRLADRPLGVAIGAAAGVWVAAASAIAGALEVSHGPFTVERAVLEGLSGSLEIRVIEGHETQLHVAGPAEAVKALKVDAAAGVLTVTAPASGHSVTVVERMTVVTGPGASSNVVIGGTSTSTSSASSSSLGLPLDIVLEVPAGTGLTLLGFTGKAEIGDLAGAVVIQAVGGTVDLGAVKGAELAAIGKGRIEVASIEGDLVASVTGEGHIAVAGGTIGKASVDVTGVGSVSVDAPAQSANVNMVGAGDVRFVSVAEPPTVSRVGAGRFGMGPP